MTRHGSYKFQLEIWKKSAFYPISGRRRESAGANTRRPTTRWLVILRESFCPLRPFSPGKERPPLDFSLSRLSDSSAIRRLYSPFKLHPGYRQQEPTLLFLSLPRSRSLFLSLHKGFIYYPRLLQRTAASGQLSARSSPRRGGGGCRDTWCVKHVFIMTRNPVYTPPRPKILRATFFAAVGPVCEEVH